MHNYNKQINVYLVGVIAKDFLQVRLPPKCGEFRKLITIKTVECAWSALIGLKHCWLEDLLDKLIISTSRATTIVKWVCHVIPGLIVPFRPPREWPSGNDAEAVTLWTWMEKFLEPATEHCYVLEWSPMDMVFGICDTNSANFSSN